VDKGTLDVFLTQGNAELASSAAVVAEAYRCLRPGGAWFMVSTDAQDLRTSSFQNAADAAAAAAAASAASAPTPAPTPAPASSAPVLLLLLRLLLPHLDASA
jgi:hypothetical protein